MSALLDSFRDCTLLSALPSLSTIQRILSQGDIKPQQWSYWLNCHDPDKWPKIEEICALYHLAADPNRLVFCIDECPIRVTGRKYPSLPMQPGKPERREYEYVRHGSLNLFAALDIHSGKVEAQFTRHRWKEDFLDFISYLMWLYPTQRLHFVLDNLNIHKSEWVKRRVAEEEGRVSLHFTPFHCSWVNQVELWFGTLARHLLKRGDFSSRSDCANKGKEYVDYYNRILAHPYQWTYRGKVLVK